MMNRKFMVSVMMMAMLVLASAVSAQDTCFSLSADDCQAINDGYAGLEGVNSFAMDYSINFSVTGLPADAGFSELTFSNAGSGTMSMDMAAAFPIQMDMTMTTNATGPQPVNNVATALRIVDGILYIDAAGTGEWMGANLAEAMENPEALGLPFDPNALATGDMSGLEAAGVDPAMMMGMAETFGTLSAVDGFLTYVRDGNTFTFTADTGVLINDPAFTQALATAGESNPDFAQFAMLGGILPMVVENGTIVVNQVVNPELGAVDTIEFLMDFTVNGAMLDPSMTDPIVVDLDFRVQISDPNGAFEFIAPDNVTMQELPAGN
ncbi:MAG: hypothetical protein ACPG7F_12045 [Aggregatilineales bacterium]